MQVPQGWEMIQRPEMPICYKRIIVVELGCFLIIAKISKFKVRVVVDFSQRRECLANVAITIK